MHAPCGDDRFATAEPDLNALLRMRIADAAFVAEGVTLGLLLKWAERAPPFDDLPPRVLRRRAGVGRPLILRWTGGGVAEGTLGFVKALLTTSPAALPPGSRAA